MFFEAELRGTYYKVNVEENRHEWKVSIQEQDKEWAHHLISKNNFQELEQIILLLFKGSSYLMDVCGSGTEYQVYTRGSYRIVNVYNDEMLLHESLKRGGSFANEAVLSAGMPGKIVKVFVQKGDEVAEGQPIVIMEAMKMENEMRAPKDVVIKEIFVGEGDSVESGAMLVAYE